MSYLNSFMGMAALVASTTPKHVLVKQLREYTEKYEEAREAGMPEEILEETFQEIVVSCNLIMLKNTDLAPEDIIAEIEKIEKASDLLKPIGS